MNGSRIAHWEVLREPKFVAAMRREARGTLREWGLHDQVDEVILILSELVTNALVHGEGPIYVTLQVDRYGAVLDGAVSDGGDGRPREQVGEDEFTEHGRGLILVDHLATRWGVSRNIGGPGKTVWFCRIRPTRDSA